MSNIFLPWLISEKIQQPLILYIDGHRSHLTIETSEFCSANRIVLIALFPNVTHMLQPMDVGVFHPLQFGWEREIREWKISNDTTKVTKENFASILEKAISKTVTINTLKNSFRACGLARREQNKY